MIKDIPVNERPREKLLLYGKENLSDKEILSILIKSGTKENNVTNLALELLKKYKLSDFQDISIEKLIEVKGIGKIKAIEILAAIEFGKRVFTSINEPLKKIDSAEHIFNIFKYDLGNKKQEYFYALYFNVKKELLSKKMLFKGTLNQSTVHPREIFKEAYRLSAAYIICIHNHPSNDTTPSNEDIKLTNTLVETGKIQGIQIIDHIIIGRDNYYSFYENMKL